MKEQRLTPIKFVEKRKGRDYWLMKCSCGNEHTVWYSNYKYNRVRSCGCIKREQFIKRVTKHGHTTGHFKKGNPWSRTYMSWISMRQRCLNKNYNHYDNYGGRGITICERWLDSFNNFLEDMGSRPNDTSLDRIDVNGNYCKNNCRWATRKEQSRNRRNNVKTEFNGRVYGSQSELIEENGFNASNFKRKMQFSDIKDRELVSMYKKELNGHEKNYRMEKKTILKKLKESTEYARVLFTCLDEREIEIMQMRLGLTSGHRITLKEIGEKFGITRERVRQIEFKAIKKMKEIHEIAVQ